MDRKGYKAGILVGLCLYALGALLFVPAASANSFGVFLFALFVIASGLGCTKRPPTRTPRCWATRRAPNGGSTRPVVQRPRAVYRPVDRRHAVLLCQPVRRRRRSERGEDDLCGDRRAGAADRAVVQPHPAAGDPRRGKTGAWHDSAGIVAASAFRRRGYHAVLLRGGAGGRRAFFINYATEHWREVSNQSASYLLSIAMICFMVGRFFSTG